MTPQRIKRHSYILKLLIFMLLFEMCKCVASFKIVSHSYFSNCMIEAIKAKIHNPAVKLYFIRPQIYNGKFRMCHFMWSDGKADYDFSDLNENGLPLYKTLFFKGCIRKFKLGFAEKYANMRNKKMI